MATAPRRQPSTPLRLLAATLVVACLAGHAAGVRGRTSLRSTPTNGPVVNFAVKLLDALTGESLAGVSITVEVLKVVEKVTRYTDKDGWAEFSSDHLDFRILAQKKGYILATKDISLRRYCGERTGDDCVVQLAMSPELKGEDLGEGCGFAARPDGSLDWEMRAVLEWNSGEDLNLWARSWDCFEDTRIRYQCPYAGQDQDGDLDIFGGVWQSTQSTDQEERCRRTDFTKPEVAQKEQQTCGMKTCAFSDGVIDAQCAQAQMRYHANQWSKWLDEESGAYYVDDLQYRWNGSDRVVLPGAEAWMGDSYMKLDAHTEGGFGPETVTFRNPPPGTYQLVVNRMDPNSEASQTSQRTITDESPLVTVYLGNSAVFDCEIDPDCAIRSRLWNVANIRIEEDGDEFDALGRRTGRKRYRASLVDTKQPMKKLHSLDLPTTEELAAKTVRWAPGPFGVPNLVYEHYFKSRYKDNDEYVQKVCYGSCRPRHSNSANRGCVASCKGKDAFGSCAAPAGVSWAAESPCAEGSCIGNGLTCTAQCADGWVPSAPSLGCKGGTLVPSTFQCLPAACNVQNSNKEPGKSCECADGFVGAITWRGAATTEDSICTPAPCSVEHSTGEPGSQCRCADSYAGTITWQGPHAIGQCEPAKCDVPNSNRLPGTSCACDHGFEGTLSWNGAKVVGQCNPVPCGVEHSNHEPGPECACEPGFIGDIVWEGTRVSDSSQCMSAKLILEKLVSQLEAKEEQRRILNDRSTFLSGADAARDEDGTVVERCCCEVEAPTLNAEAQSCELIRAYPKQTQRATRSALRKPKTLSVDWFRRSKWLCPENFNKAEREMELKACEAFKASRDRRLQEVKIEINEMDLDINGIIKSIDATREYLH
mmetsp:Transcript_31798/g.83653  ORF Transcript_31798/g.83653 Transcript_31798/m.83653 type:complete len:876 (-) Transcript_31798:119-2746(-)